MKLFIEYTGLGLVKSQLVKAELSLAANKLGWTIVEDSASADLIVAPAGQIPAALEGQLVFSGQLDQLFQQPQQYLQEAQAKAVPCQKTQTPVTAETSTSKFIVGVTACPTGVAHTFMAAEAIEAEAKKRGWKCKVETRGSVGAGNELTAAEIAAADLVIVAADIEVDLSKFAGKLMYRTRTGPALKKTAEEFDRAFQEATTYQTLQNTQIATTAEKKGGYQHLLTGVSYMLPMVVAGGLIIALSFAVGGIMQEGELAQALGKIGGSAALTLMVPLLAGYISFSIADRPGLAPGLIGGMLASSIGAGFLGGIVAGYLAGYLTAFLTKVIPMPKGMEALKPILILPFLVSLIVGLVMIFVIGAPIAKLMYSLEAWLSNMHTSNAVILGAILGGMMCTDMGGPINKVAYSFGVGLLSSQQYMPMAAIMAGGMVPPLAMSLATFLAKNKFAASERESGKAAFVLGLCFISEGAIPFAARDPMRVLPVCMLGGAVTGGLSMVFGAKLMAPHGGIFVLGIPGAITPVLEYILAIAAGSILSGALYALLKQPETSAV